MQGEEWEGWKEKQSIDQVAAFVVLFSVEEDLAVVFVFSSRLFLSSEKAVLGNFLHKNFR